MPEVPLNDVRGSDLVLVVPTELGHSGPLDWTFMPNVPGHLWNRPYGLVKLVQSGHYWTVQLENVQVQGCYPTRVEYGSDYGTPEQGRLANVLTQYSSAVLLVAPDELDLIRDELNDQRFFNYAVVSVPGPLKIRGNLGPVPTTAE